MADSLPAIVVVLPLVVSLFIFGSHWWRTGAAYPLALATLTVNLLVALQLARKVFTQGVIHYWLGGWQPPWGIECRVDHLAAGMLVLITFLALISAIYGARNVAREFPDRGALFWSLYLLMITGLVGIVVTADLFNLFVMLEVASLSGYCLVAIGRGKALVASYRYLIIGTIGASFYLLGVGYLYISTGSLNMADLRTLLVPLYDSRVVRAAFGFIFVGFAIKMALFPMHAWQPDVYTYAPSTVSIIISTAVAKAFTYALIRVIFAVFGIDFLTYLPVIGKTVGWIAALAMVAGSVFAIRQTNFKRMLAYSSVANVGYIVMAVGLAPATSLGLTPAVMHLFNHAVTKGGLFMAACAIIHQYDLRHIERFEGLGRRMPYTALTLILASLAMIGMPPGVGFITKWYLIQAALEAGQPVFVGLIFASTLLMIVYFWRVIEVIYIRPATALRPAPNPGISEVPPSMLWPGLLLGGLGFALGIVWMTGLFNPLLMAVNAGFGLGGVP